MDEVEGDKAAEVARQRKDILSSYLYPDSDEPVPGRYADPMAFMQRE